MNETTMKDESNFTIAIHFIHDYILVYASANETLNNSPKKKGCKTSLFGNYRLYLYSNKENMNITGSEKFEKFCKKYNDAQPALEKWVTKVTKASWKNHNELKNDYLSADYVGNNRYVFNIKGNKYRLIVLVVFLLGTLIFVLLEPIQIMMLLM